MDFIKTSSLRALSELTFQRNWNGLIWMSRKGVITKRVKTVQTALSRTSGQAVQRLAENDVPLGQIKSVRLSLGQSSNHPAEHFTTREAMSRGRPRHAHSRRCRARPCRASREATPRGRASLLIAGSGLPFSYP
ncbi:unnamed protein product [Microthlaspi erraticum]|uniref:Uncharacterized protein n=1 Tax=Microthlaspi erraticum TaxID=1685480 RepID=A0A6D2J1N8_9BRAS|nr:unnamed protein product [Microthlaspi erraticum]